ncbi:MAG: ATP-binding protein, partial [bacterium]
MVDINSFQLQNPWRLGQFIPQRMFQRRLLQEVLAWINDPDILVIIGSRQVGKTTLLSQIIEHLLANGTSAIDIFYFNLDDWSLQDFFKTPADFLNFVEVNKKNRAYVFIDEVQRLENPGLFLKYIYDLKKNIKLIVSGSSSLEIRAKVSESLTGRKRLFNLRPFSFDEFVTTKWPGFPAVAGKLAIGDSANLLSALGQAQSLYQASLEKWLAEYLQYGGYPRVVLEANAQRKIALLQEIYTSYLQKDIKDFFKIENIAGYNNLLKILSQQIGNLVNVSTISNILSLNQATVDKYLLVLEGTFIFKRLTPFFQNVRRELSKMPKIYALDLGLRNFAAGN